MSQSVYRNIPLFCPSDLVNVKADVQSNDLTWRSEGKETKKYFSRLPSVPPGGNSGITIGRGYDMGSRTAKSVKNDLTAAGFDPASIDLLAGGAGLKGSNATKYLNDNNLRTSVCITPLQQENLFTISMKFYVSDTKRLYTKWVHKDHNATPWDNLDQKTKDLLVDLHYRGDLTSKSFGKIKEDLTAAKRKSLVDDMNERSNWSNVPDDRFKARVDFLKSIAPPAASSTSTPLTKAY